MSEHTMRPEDLDRLGNALISLTKELWVAKDRIRTLEAALVNAGVLDADAVEKLQPDEQLQTELREDRSQLIEQVLKALENRSGS